MAEFGRLEANAFPQLTEAVAGKLAALSHEFLFAAQLRTDGISSFTMDVVLAKNALVRVFDVIVQAKHASATPVSTVAQVRATSSVNPAAIVVDFGTPRTVSGIEVHEGLQIVGLTPWLGTAFAPQKAYPEDPAGTATNRVILRKEIRTERLLVEVSGTPTEGASLLEDMAVMLPEAPTDLEIRIDGGPPVARFPGPAQPGPDASLSDKAWNEGGFTIAHLGDALASLTGDPTSRATVTFKVVLSSRVPGELGLGIPQRNRIPPLAQNITLGPPVVSYINRVMFEYDTTKELIFGEEGVQAIDLKGLPNNSLIEEIRFELIGALPEERVIPSVGPDKAGLADLALTPDRAACVRLRPGTNLSELTGVRLPLLAGSNGAEMRVVLWRPDSDAEPFEAMEDGVSEPVTLNPGSQETWTTFSFKQPVTINDTNPPWAALLVSRGEVTWSLGAKTADNDPIEANRIRSGAPVGPWKPLPSIFQAPDSPLRAARGRIRAIGHSRKDAPIAPLKIMMGSPPQAVEVTPTAKGITARQVFLTPVTSPVLQVVSLVPGNVTLRNLDVVTG